MARHRDRFGSVRCHSARPRSLPGPRSRRSSWTDSGPDTKLVILEGHVRATAMAMAGGDLRPRTALLGRSKAVGDQWFY